MGEYGNGMTLSQAFTYDKERIKQALQGKLIAGETEDGFVYGEAPKEECNRYILETFDNAVYHVLQLAHVGRAYDKILKNRGIEVNDIEFIKALESTETIDEYEFEDEFTEEDDE